MSDARISESTLSDGFDTVDSGALPSEAHADHDVPPGTAVGRYIVLHTLGEGGNGVVYAAYDPKLDRKIALKLVRPTPSNHARLLREAQALAKLNHPNVVAVHDVGTVSDRVFVAMELVEGSTLRDWLRAEPRGMRDVLRVYLAAGDGLVAAHARGLVHRDFKPDNVLVSQDGLVRVVDFGLAVKSNTTPGDESSETELPARALDIRLTRANGIMGTPGYMAPEQYQRSASDVRTDQFSFCAALFEGLCNELPFAGESFETLQESTCEGRLLQPKRWHALPSHIQRALLRGLSVERDERWPDMSELLAELRRDRAAPLRRAAVVLLAASTLVTMGLLAVNARSKKDQLCSGADALVARALNDKVEGRISSAFVATGLPYAETARGAVIQALRSFGSRWSVARREACLATRVRGEQSEEVLAARLDCLDGQLEQSRVLAELLGAGGRDAVAHAAEASQHFPRVDDCSDVSALLSPDSAPSNPELQERVLTLRHALPEARALIASGAYSRAAHRLSELADEARAIAYLPLHAELQLELGRAEVGLGEYEKAEATLSSAEQLADESRHDRVRGEAMLERVEVTGRWLGHYAQAERDAFHVAHLARRLRKEELVWAALDASSRVHGYQGKLDDAVREGRESVALATKLFGASDLRLARAHGALSNALAELGEFEESEREDRMAMQIHERLLGPSHPSMVRMLTNLATGLVWAGRAEDALQVAHKAEALATQELGADHPQRGLAWNVIGYAEVALGHFREGLEANQRSVSVYEHHGANYVETVYPLAGMGEALLGLGRAAEAADVLTRATDLAEAHGLDAETMGVCHFHLGRALWLARGERTKAVTLVQQAVADFGRVPRLRTVRARAERWLDENAGPVARR